MIQTPESDLMITTLDSDHLMIKSTKKIINHWISMTLACDYRMMKTLGCDHLIIKTLECIL